MFVHLDFSIHGDVVACRRRELFVAPAVSLLNSSHAEFDTSKVNINCKLFYTLSEASMCIFVKMVGLSVAGWWTLWILAQWLEFDLFLSSPLWDVDGFRQASFSLYHTHTHTHLTTLFPGLPRWASTRKVKPIWILVKQETVSGSGISWAICKYTDIAKFAGHLSHRYGNSRATFITFRCRGFVVGVRELHAA